jgi:hypothetical protein
MRIALFVLNDLFFSALGFVVGLELQRFLTRPER